MLTIAEINEHLHTQIPITRSMGIKVVKFCATAVHTSAPLEANINHQESAFGGSIATLGIITGFVAIWGYLKLQAKEAELVIQHSETEFSKPALGPMLAESRNLSEMAMKEFVASLESTGKSRILVTSDIFSEGKLVATNTGTFVALNQEK